MIKVVHCKKSAHDVYIGRPTIFGNPFVMKNESQRVEVLNKFRDYARTRMKTDTEFRDAVLSLDGKTLGCFCSPKPCHGDVIGELLEEFKNDEFTNYIIYYFDYWIYF